MTLYQQQHNSSNYTHILSKVEQSLTKVQLSEAAEELLKLQAVFN